MNIVVNKAADTFHLYNDDISYIMTVLPNGQLGQVYFGKKIREREDYSHLVETATRPMSSCVFDTDKRFSMEHLRQEYAVFGTSDYRTPATEVVQKNGSRISEFCFRDYRIESGKPILEGLPATYTENAGEASTLITGLEDPVTGLRLELLYTIFAKGGSIARSARFSNHGRETLHLTSAMSLCMDLPDCCYDWMQFSGAWARERYPKTRQLEQGILSVGSMRGNSSHNHNPFVILKRPDTDEFQGEAIGFSLIYSGNFLAQAEVDTYDTTRVLMGIHPSCFDWKLEAGESFQTPEAVMVYTDQGLNHLSQTFHRLYQKRLARGYWRDRERPILINNWEATCFDFTEEKLLEIARTAKETGVELFVLDDGWFGERSNEHAGLGDWFANTKRLPQGITGLSKKIGEIGMKFGLWFEPEMVNKDSDLYRQHPDWIIAAPERRQSHGRFQYVLDFSRSEVVDGVWEMMERVLSSANIEYVKWDMNRPLSDLGSAALPPDRQGELSHRYMLGVYSLQERLVSRFPNILLENCSGGGARYDAGMLYYSPQIWCSDDTDAIERLAIQEGTALIYPLSTIGAHVSDCPNHAVGRVTPFETRGYVALAGTFGYELDVTRIPEEDRKQIPAQTAMYHKYNDLVREGDYFRLASASENQMYDSWQVVSKDGTESLVTFIQVKGRTGQRSRRVFLRGLHPDKKYRIEGEDGVFGGDTLMYAGLQVAGMWGDFQGKLIHLVQV